MNKPLKLTVLTLALWFIPLSLWAQEDWQTKTIPLDVESGVICVLDGCMMNLSVCETSAAEKLRLIIREKMYKDGLNKEQTYAYLAHVYGEKVLAAPPKKGFNWTVWLLPFVATIGGGAIIYLGLEKWVQPDRSDPSQVKTVPVDPHYEDKLRQELKKYL